MAHAKEEKYSARLQQALSRILSCQQTVEEATMDLELSHKQLKRYLFTHGHQRTLNMDIVLFDLNGTLIHRTDRNRTILVRPNIQELRRLKKHYRIGIFTSVTRYNALSIMACIEDICGRIFDRHLIFTRESTIPFTDMERLEHNLPEHKTKKCLRNLFAPEHLDRIHMVDDELVRIVEKDQATCIKGWYGEPGEDTELRKIVDELIARKHQKNEPIANMHEHTSFLITNAA